MTWVPRTSPFGGLYGAEVVERLSFPSYKKDDCVLSGRRPCFLVASPEKADRGGGHIACDAQRQEWLKRYLHPPLPTPPAGPRIHPE